MTTKRWKSLTLLATLAVFPAGASMAQVAKPADPIAPLPEGAMPAPTVAPPVAEPVLPPPFWQVLLSMLASLVAACVTVWFASKVFRVGLLMHGKPPNLATLIRWARMS